MCFGMLSMFAFMILSLLGWVAYEIGKKVGDNKSIIARSVGIVFYFLENAYQSIKARQKNILIESSNT